MFSDHARIIKNAHLRTCLEHRDTKAPRNKNAFAFCGAFGVVSTRRVRRTMRMKKRTRNLLGENFSNRNAYTSNEAAENKDEFANQRPESNQTRSKLQSVEYEQPLFLLCYFPLRCTRTWIVFPRTDVSRRLAQNSLPQDNGDGQRERFFITMGRW